MWFLQNLKIECLRSSPILLLEKTAGKSSHLKSFFFSHIFLFLSLLFVLFCQIYQLFFNPSFKNFLKYYHNFSYFHSLRSPPLFSYLSFLIALLWIFLISSRLFGLYQSPLLCLPNIFLLNYLYGNLWQKGLVWLLSVIFLFQIS